MDSRPVSGILCFRSVNCALKLGDFAQHAVVHLLASHHLPHIAMAGFHIANHGIQLRENLAPALKYLSRGRWPKAVWAVVPCPKPNVVRSFPR